MSFKMIDISNSMSGWNWLLFWKKASAMEVCKGSNHSTNNVHWLCT